MNEREAHLQAESRRLSALVNSSPNPVWQRDAKLSLTFCNTRFSEMLDPASDELMDFAQIELFRGHRDMARRAQEAGVALSEEHYIVSEGKRTLYRITEVPASDGSVNGYGVDISETEAVREQMQRHLSAQRDFLESTTSAMAVFGPDQRLQTYNASYSRIWKLDESLLNRKPTYSEILEALREQRLLPEQANFPAFKQKQLKWFTDLMEPYEEFFYLPDGKTLRMVIIPHALGGLLFAYEDVTDRLALERSYNTLIAVQQETLDNIYESVVVIGEDGRVKLCNPAFLRLWEVDEAAMSSQPHIRDAIELFQELLFFRNWDEYKTAFIHKMQDRTNEMGKVELRNGKVLVWRKVALPDGGTLLAHYDVTDTELLERSLRERNQALEAADKLKTEFLANVSYELRSPLTSIAGFADILQKDYFGTLTDKQREYVEGISQSSNQLSVLINNILDLASIEAGYMQLQKSDVDIYALSRNTLEQMNERAKAFNIKLKLQCPEDIGTLWADEIRLKQVFMNLLSNAIKYSEHGSDVQFCIARHNGSLECRVIDQGVGIEPEKQGLIFDRFYRAGASRGQQSGSGLGLSIVKSFIELHGGQVDVQSAPGQGASFICRIPVG